jgi:hypothetical protein
LEALIQLELPLRWYENSLLWDDKDDTPSVIDTVHRGTEYDTLRNLYDEAKVIERHGRLEYLSWAHRLVMRMEITCLQDYPSYSTRRVVPDENYPHEYIVVVDYPRVWRWISERSTFSERQVAALLSEASQVIGICDRLGLSLDEADNEDVIQSVAA